MTETILDWQDYAACLGSDPETFFPVGQSILASLQAKQMCRRCPVRALCLDWAVSTRQYAGVWGGLSEQERAPLYETPDRSATRCFNAQEWVEAQIADGRQQKVIARELGVDPHVLCRAISKWRAEPGVQAPVGEGAKA